MTTKIFCNKLIRQFELLGARKFLILVKAMHPGQLTEIAKCFDQKGAITGKRIYLNLALKILLMIHPHDFDAIHALGTTYLHLKNYAEAEKYYRRANRLRKYPGFEIDLGNVLRQLKKYNAAKRTYKKYVKKYPNSWIGWYNLAQLCHEAGDLRESANASKKTLQFLSHDAPYAKMIENKIREINGKSL